MCVCIPSPRLGQWPGVNHGEKKQRDIVVSARKSVLCQSTKNYRGSLCAGELERPAARCHWVSGIRPAYVCKCEKETRDREELQVCKRKREVWVSVCSVCVVVC